jgi:phage terminase large subunit-like protein
MIENGFVHLPKEAAWLAEYPHELTAFPRGRRDDQVDDDRTQPQIAVPRADK